MKKLILIFLFIFSFNIIPVFADSYENLASYYNFNFPEDSIDFTLAVDQSNHNLGDFLDDLTSLNSDIYFTYISLQHYNTGFNSVKVILIPKDSYSALNSAYVGLNAHNQYLNALFAFVTDTFNGCTVSFDFNSLNIYESSNYLNLTSYLDNGSCSLSSTNIFDTIYRYSYYLNFSNSESYDVGFPNISSNVQYYIPYYSNIPLIYSTDITNYNFNNNYDSYYKSLVFNDVSYVLGDFLPTYYDLYIGPSYSFDNFNDQLNRIFVGNIPKNNISNFKIDLKFNVNDPNYINNININRNFFGRVNHTTYYSYEKIDCSFGSTISSFAVDGNKVTGSIAPNGFTCSSDLSNYDEIFLRVDVIPNGSVDYVTYNLQLISNYGNVYNFNDINSSLTDINKLFIYEKFNNLDPHFSLMLSTNKDKGYSYYLSDTIYTISSYIDLTSKQMVYGFSSYGSISNTMYNIFNYYDYNQDNTNLLLFIDPDSIISFGSNNTYTYYDSSSNLVTDTVDNNFIYTLDDDSYDLSYYFNVINAYLYSIDGDIHEVSVLVQKCYDVIPEPFSSLIFIFFILGCMYFIIKLIKRSD